MTQLIEFAGNHPFLVAAAALMLALVIVYEVRARAQAFAAVSPLEAVRLMNQGAAVIDVRSTEDYKAGHIARAKNIDIKMLPDAADSLKKHRDKPVIVCCESGLSAAAAARSLVKLGFSKVVNLRGGLGAWRRENLPLTRDEEK